MMTRSRPYTFAFSSLGCPESTLGEVLDLAEKYKVPLVELRTLEGRTDLARLFGEQFASADALRELLDGRGIGIASLDSSAKLIGGKPEAEEELYAFGWWAHQLGIPGIRVFDGGSAERGLSSKDIEEAVAFLRRWHESCHRNGWDVDLLIETHDALSQSASVLQLEAATSVPLRILWDAHHTWKKAGGPVGAKPEKQ